MIVQTGVTVRAEAVLMVAVADAVVLVAADAVAVVIAVLVETSSQSARKAKPQVILRLLSFEDDYGA